MAETREQMEPAPPKKKIGRPSKYTPETVAEILKRISNGESLRKITKDEHMPHMDTVYLWLLKHPEFSEQYTRAREEQAETLADEIVALADEEPVQIVDDKGVCRVDSGWVTWQRNRVDARKWVAAKLKPKKYGDRVALAGDAEAPVVVQTQTAEEVREMLKLVEMKIRGTE